MQTHPFLENKKFILGTFASNCSGGMTPSKLTDGWDASWEKNLELAQLLDDAGIDFMLPIARFIGYGGEKDFQGTILETVTWATALLASTKNITVFATVHASVNHPMVIAKQIATMAEVSADRVGLNIVAGWNKPEYDALGLTLEDNHDARYGYAQEWFDFIKKLWSSDKPFDWNGKYFNTKGSYGKPKPLKSPPIFNAAGSKQGRDFAVQNADFLFTPASELERSVAEIKELKQAGKALGRNVNVMTFSHVICRETEAEAQAEWDRQVANADTEAVQNLMNLLFAHAQSFPHDILETLRQRIAVGHGGFPLVGTPEQVAHGLMQLHETGFSGTTLSFLDYAEEFPYFRDHVLPVLEKNGIR
ncbi:LLM class flavin-dependent oxidoreductase [Acinetobacter stercoris]|uniref:Pyrimidine monooxygenase RutA n=1 Tax=Acinetobacter stercoris TaxID=2126983 RepID=A0A2U3N4M8_9GAMM|nr:LLM class flavin-dependent oxidoreductase [Acinetobacter stercoris]SPL72638.1 Pyrimidine monooxygenase RutA [Acinetobacter stercoris]